MAWNEKSTINNGNQFESDVDGQFTADNLNKIVENIFFLKDAVDNAEQGGIIPSGAIDITSNGAYDVTTYATANVNVQGGSNVTLIEGTATQNGVYTPPMSGQAYSKFTVNVPSSGIPVSALTEGFTERGAIVTYVEISATNGGNIKRVNTATGAVTTSTSVSFSSSQISNNEFIYAEGDTLKIVDSMNGFEAEATAVYIYGDVGMLPYYKYNAAPESGGSGEFEWKSGADLGGYTIKAAETSDGWQILSAAGTSDEQIVFFNDWTYTRLVISPQGSTMGNISFESGGDEGESSAWLALNGTSLSEYASTGNTLTLPSPAVISFGTNGIDEATLIRFLEAQLIVTK